MRKLLLSLCLLALAACGGSSGEFSDNVPTGSTPFLSRAVPSSMGIGDTVTIFGSGFSTVSAENIVLLGSVEIEANSYEFGPADAQVGELEKITFTVPVDARLGAQTLLVTVLDNDSTNSLNVTVTP